MKLGRSVMIESGLGGQFWFSAMMAAKDARNATFKERIGTTPWMLMHISKLPLVVLVVLVVLGSIGLM